jgi:hypothetical protein
MMITTQSHKQINNNYNILSANRLLYTLYPPFPSKKSPMPQAIAVLYFSKKVPPLVEKFPILEKGSTIFRRASLGRKKGWIPHPGKGFYPMPRNWKQYGGYMK